MIGVGVIGYGYWGPNLVRNFAEVPGVRVVAVSDLRPERLALINARYPYIKTTQDANEVMKDGKVDAVVVSTPVSTHFDLAVQALTAGKHVLIEKPMTTSSEQARRLIDEATRRRLIIMVDHTFVYTGAVRKIKALIDSGELGDIYYYDSVRVNLGLFQHDVNVLWDLAVHDLAIMDYVLGSKALTVSAVAVSHVKEQSANLAYLTVFMPGNLIGHFHVNWLAPVKVRQTLIGGSRKMIVYNDIEPSEKVKIYDKGIIVNQTQESIYQLLVSYRSGDILTPQLDTTEALRTEALHFIECIEHDERPVTDGEAGLRVVRILEAAEESCIQQGQPVEVI
jgi:predicted dehydrogenase